MEKYKNKIIGFVDILGWGNLVERSEKSNDVTLNDLISYTDAFATTKTIDLNNGYQHTICPNSDKIADNLDFQKTQVSDCVILSCEKSPAGIIALIFECKSIAHNLLRFGIMCRGYITIGKVFHSTNNKIIGMGYQDVLNMEKKFGLPFVGIDPIVDEYVRRHSDSCVEKKYDNYVLKEKNFIALFPFRDLNDSFFIGSFMGIDFNTQERKDSNTKARMFIEKSIQLLMEHADPDNKDANIKTRVYLKALITELEGNYETANLIDVLEEM